MMTMDEKTKNWLCIGIVAIAGLAIVGIVWPMLPASMTAWWPCDYQKQNEMLGMIVLGIIAVWFGYSRAEKRRKQN